MKTLTGDQVPAYIRDLALKHTKHETGHETYSACPNFDGVSNCPLGENNKTTHHRIVVIPYTLVGEVWVDFGCGLRCIIKIPEKKPLVQRVEEANDELLG